MEEKKGRIENGQNRVTEIIGRIVSDLTPEDQKTLAGKSMGSLAELLKELLVLGGYATNEAFALEAGVEQSFFRRLTRGEFPPMGESAGLRKRYPNKVLKSGRLYACDDCRYALIARTFGINEQLFFELVLLYQRGEVVIQCLTLPELGLEIRSAVLRELVNEDLLDPSDRQKMQKVRIALEAAIIGTLKRTRLKTPTVGRDVRINRE